MFINVPATNRKFIALSFILLSCMTILIVLNNVSGPRVRYTETILNSQTNELHIIAHTNRTLKPDAKISATISGDSLEDVVVDSNTLSAYYRKPLQHGQNYTIEISGITDTDGKRAKIYTHQFKTKPAQVSYLRRDNNAKDTIYTNTVAGSSEKALVSLQNIRTFAYSQSFLVVVSNDEKAPSTDEILLYSKSGSHKKTIKLPGFTEIQKIQVSPFSDFAAITVSSSQGSNRKYDITLFKIDLLEGKISELNGLDGKPVSALKILLAPDGSSLVYKTIMSTVFIETLNGQSKPIAFGGISDFSAFSSDSKELIVTSNAGIVERYDISKKISSGALPDEFQSTFSIGYVGSSKSLLAVHTMIGDFLEAYGSLSIESNSTASSIYKVETKEYLLASATSSSNGEFASVEKSKPSSIFDDYGTFSKPKDNQAVVVSVAKPENNSTIQGSQISWQPLSIE